MKIIASSLLVLGLLAIVGYASRSPSATQSASSAILGFFPHDPQLTTLLHTVQQHAGTLGIVGISLAVLLTRKVESLWVILASGLLELTAVSLHLAGGAARSTALLH